MWPTERRFERRGLVASFVILFLTSHFPRSEISWFCYLCCTWHWLVAAWAGIASCSLSNSSFKRLSFTWPSSVFDLLYNSHFTYLPLSYNIHQYGSIRRQHFLWKDTSYNARSSSPAWQSPHTASRASSASEHFAFAGI
ncbi:hypothetical protein F4604DRAFT_320926 [Suillus subluteus]|nr:hypothetical protein F4604DRAFT_320926 [Suillus subluteus]